MTSFFRDVNDNSYLWHVRAGGLQLRTGSVITADPFSFTMQGEAWRTQSWLAELAYSYLDRLMGLDSTPLIATAMSALLFVILGLVAYRRSKSLPSVAVYLVLTSLVFAAFFNPRPVIFSFPLFAAVVASDQDRRLRWALPVLMWVWAAVHGSFVIGLIYLGLRALGRGLSRRRVAELLLIGAVTLFTAHGWGVVEMLLAFIVNRDAVDLMSEWQHPDLLSPPFVPLFLAIVLIVWLSGKGLIGRRDWWVLVPFLALSVSAARAVPPAWIALTPIIGRFRLPIASPTLLRPALTLGISGVLLLGPFLLMPDLEVDRDVFPVEAAGHLATERVFHDDVTGAWLVYTQWPDRRIYIDDRAEFFGERIGLMNRVRNGVANWEAEFESLGITEALLRSDTPLLSVLTSSGWQTAYSDDTFVVLRSPD